MIFWILRNYRRYEDSFCLSLHWQRVYRNIKSDCEKTCSVKHICVAIVKGRRDHLSMDCRPVICYGEPRCVSVDLRFLLQTGCSIWGYEQMRFAEERMPFSREQVTGSITAIGTLLAIVKVLLIFTGMEHDGIIYLSSTQFGGWELLSDLTEWREDNWREIKWMKKFFAK